MGTWEHAWAGAIHDTECQTRSGVFESMQWFVDHFDKGIPLTNIVDKGYRRIIAAWRAGKQLFQPAFARSDRQRNTREINRSSTLASDRSGNEISCQRGQSCGRSQARLATEWESQWHCRRLDWGFQADFMCKPVL